MRRNFTTIELLGLPSKKIGRFTRIHPDGSKAVRADMDLISPSSRIQHAKLLDSIVCGIGRVNKTILVHDDTVKIIELTRFTAWTAPRELESQILIEDLNAVVAHVADVEIAELV
jgi:hypothetical protein